MRQRQLVRVAYHEAGHALIAHLTGCEIISATIKPNAEANYLGALRVKMLDLCEVAEKAPELLDLLVVRAGAGLLAGRLAENKLVGRETRRRYDSDYDEALRVADWVTDSREASKALVEQWKASDALLAYQQLAQDRRVG